MECPKCNDLNLNTEIDKDITYYFCVECGYTSNTNYNPKNFEFQSTLTFMNSEFKKMIWKDSKTGLYWLPISFNIPKIGILYPEENSGVILWVYMPMVDISDDAELKKRNPGKTEIPDQLRKKTFTKENLKEALKLLKVL